MASNGKCAVPNINSEATRFLRKKNALSIAIKERSVIEIRGLGSWHLNKRTAFLNDVI